MQTCITHTFVTWPTHKTSRYPLTGCRLRGKCANSAAAATDYKLAIYCSRPSLHSAAGPRGPLPLPGGLQEGFQEPSLFREAGHENSLALNAEFLRAEKR
jgi:hypothetical protein